MVKFSVDLEPHKRFIDTTIMEIVSRPKQIVLKSMVGTCHVDGKIISHVDGKIISHVDGKIISHVDGKIIRQRQPQSIFLVAIIMVD